MSLFEKTTWRVGWLLGWRQIAGTKRGTAFLISAIMTLTFLNLVAISGILVGLIEGGNQANKNQYTGDIIITALPDKSYIQKTQSLLQTLKEDPFVEHTSTRFVTGASVEANYGQRRNFQALPNTVTTSIAGINVVDEESVTGLSKYIIEGDFLDPEESGYIVLGATLLQKYSAFSDLFEPLKDVAIGDTVKVSVSRNMTEDVFGRTTELTDSPSGQNIQEFIVKGIIKSKVDEVSVRTFVTESDLRRLVGGSSLDADEIAIRIVPGVSPDRVKENLVRAGFGSYAKIQTALEAIPKFLDNIRITFGILGNVIGSIGLIVASITIFIVIYINAVTRRKYIGILKAIGIQRTAIVIAYTLQAMWYAVIGSGLGLCITYALLIPLFNAHPLNFPFSDGILVAPLTGTFIKLIILLVVTFIAGAIPAWLIVRQNTLDSILGR